jgi:hypothetical protein
MYRKYGTAGQATDNNIIWRMRIACRITKGRYTHSEYVILYLMNSSNDSANAPQCYTIRTVPLFSALPSRKSTDSGPRQVTPAWPSTLISAEPSLLRCYTASHDKCIWEFRWHFLPLSSGCSSTIRTITDKMKPGLSSISVDNMAGYFVPHQHHNGYTKLLSLNEPTLSHSDVTLSQKAVSN